MLRTHRAENNQPERGTVGTPGLRLIASADGSATKASHHQWLPVRSVIRIRCELSDPVILQVVTHALQGQKQASAQVLLQHLCSLERAQKILVVIGLEVSYESPHCW